MKTTKNWHWHDTEMSAFRLARNADTRLRADMLRFLLACAPAETIEEFVKAFE